MIPFILSLFIGFLGLSALALGMARHYPQFWGQAAPPQRLRRNRILGWALLASSYLPCLTEWNAAIGLIVWVGILSLALIAVACMLASTQA